MTDRQLIEELEKATEGSRELDRLIGITLGPFFIHGEQYGEPAYCYRDSEGSLVRPGNASDMLVPRYTTDFNATRELVEREAEKAFGEFVLMGVHRCRHKVPFDGPRKGKYEWTGWLRLHAQDAVEGKSYAGPEVALLLALLKSMETDNG